MLAAAAYAINIAENGVPATAPALFIAGVYNGFSGKDLRAPITACFAPDQKLADDVDVMLAAIKAKDFGSIKAIAEGDEAIAIADADACINDPQYQAVSDAYDFQSGIVTKAMADPDWQLHAIKDIRPHLADIKTGAAASIAAWYLGTDEGYFQAGVEIGKIDKIVFAYWI